MREAGKVRLLGCDQSELDELVVQAGQPEYRGRQLFEAIYRQRLTAVEEVSTLPAEMRREFAVQVGIGLKFHR